MKFRSLAFLGVILIFMCSVVVSAKETLILVIDGSVFWNGELAPNGWNVEVTNKTQNLNQSSKTGTAGDGRYGVTFLTLEPEGVVAATDNEIEIVVTDADGNERSKNYKLDDNDIDANSATIDIFIYTKFPRWDVNEDGIVDIADLVLVGIHFGEDYRTQVPISPSAGEMRSKSSEGDLWVEVKAQMDSVPYLHVQLKITPIIDLYGYQFDLNFDSTALELLTAKVDSVLKQDGAQTYWTISEQESFIRTMCVRQATHQGINVNETLATIIFQVKDMNYPKDNSLRLTNIKLADSNAQLIPINIRPTNPNLSRLFIPQKSLLAQNYPNPFNPETWIPYQLASDSHVAIRIYNIKGQLIRALYLGDRKSGFYMTKDRAAYWDGKDSLGKNVASGIYYYTLQTEDFIATRKMIMLK